MTIEPEIIGITPFERPNITLLRAMARTSAYAVLDLGSERECAEQALQDAERCRIPCFGVRMHSNTSDIPLSNAVQLIILDRPRILRPEQTFGRMVLTQVCSLAEAEQALANKSGGLIVKGLEAAGRVLGETSFVLMQRMLAFCDLPVWVQGGIGIHTAAAVCAAGARGVVLDAQLALFPESACPAPLRARLEAMSGDETRLIEGERVLFVHDEGGQPGAPRAIPIGQDAALAGDLVARYGGLRAAIEAFQGALRALPAQARALAPLARERGIACSHGTLYPIAQGPMTRVSDNADFAAAVAEAGALPFLALSLLRGDALRTLLQTTARVLGDRSWGVGILGFAPEDVCSEQLAVLREVRPSVALIAGARLALARELSELGIASYLHVPSPKLLDHFIEQGQRHFVFEGSECGGHIGPLTSFTLWQQMLNRLTREASLKGYHVLFAGGIHDARSAAVVAVLATALCARGARCGVLMGTAYLFTEEAVAHGAITPEFQRQALVARRTVVLESGPGHATRALDGPFYAQFSAERARLSAEGASAREISAALETLNLGRLRIASKGLRRTGSNLVRVEEHEQRESGLFMSGQVAALRTAPISAGRLHRDVSDGSAELLARGAPARAEVGDARDIAIVGMACLYPGANDLDEFWLNVLSGASFVTEVPEQRWQKALYYAEAGGRGKSVSKWGGFVPTQAFDARELGIPPSAVTSLDPAQILALLVAKQALRDASAEDEADKSRIGVVVGAESSADVTAQYLMRAFLPGLLGALPPELDARLLDFTEDSFPGVLANVIAGRLSNRLDLGGPNYVVNAACASSLAALECACRELEAGTCDLMLAGGVDVHNSVYDYLMFTSVQALSPRGVCRTFDAQADGIALAEGVGFVALRRFEDALARGDRIYARIRAVASTSDGRSRSLTAPRPEGQLRVLREAYRRAGVRAADLGLLEAHGTGTIVGDRVELEVLTEFMRESGADVAGCALGSVKAQIGHAKCAAGMAGLIKTALAVHHGVIPAACNLERPNDGYDPEISPFAFYREARPWFSPGRRAGVSAFGFGGTNYHAVLESASHVAPSSARLWPCELILFRAPSVEHARASASALCEQLRALEPHARPNLSDLAAHMSQNSERALPVQLAIVADSTSSLFNTLESLDPAGSGATGVFWARELDAEAKLAFLFPGQGSQRVGMLRELALYFPEVRAELSALGELTKPLYPPLDPRPGAEETLALRDTRNAQPVLAAADLALARVLARFGVRPDVCAGHSFGELVALCCAGVIAPTQLYELSHARAAAMVDASAGQNAAMSALFGSAERAQSMLDGIEQVWLANLNSPRQTIIAGEVAAVAQVEARARARGLVVRRLEAPYAFHTPRLLAAQQSFERTLAGVEMKAAAFDVWSNATAQPYPQELATLRALLARQLISPVRFEALVRDMYRTGARLFLEVGPGEVLSGLVRDTLQELPHTMISCDRPSRGSLRSLLETLAQLATCGIPVDERAAFVDREPRTISLDERPRLPFRADGARVWNAAAPPPPSTPIGPLSAAPAAAGVLDERRKTVREYLELTRTLVETQREVMLAYLQPYPRAAPPEHKPLERADVHSERATIAAVGEVGNAGGSPEETLCALFAERTGYPPEMLQTNSDLEAELGIDSIKRMEVLQRFLERSPLEAGAKERGVAALMQQRSVGAICSELARLGLHEGAALDGTLPRASRDVVACERPSVSAPPEQLLRALLAERTGYALEMLDDDADLEGELGIDSIKRTEVLQQFLERQPLYPVERERKLERMLRARTVSAICAALEQAPHPARPGILPDTCAQEARREEAAARTKSLLRLVPQALATSPATARAPQASRVAITGEAREVCEAVVRRLRALGVEASPVAAPEDLGDSFDALVCLSALDRTDLDPAKRAFAWVRAAVRAELHAVLGVTALGGDLGMQPNQAAGAGGISGLLKSFAREHAATRFRILDVARAESVEDLAGHVCDELFADDELLEVGRRAKARFVSRALPSERPNAPRVALTSDHVLLLVGGARGITRAVAHGLHARFGCKLVLAGRSDPTFARGAEFDVRDVAAARRAALAQDPHLSARELDRAAHELRAARDCALGLHALESTGARVDYHSLDIRDPAAVRALYAAIEQSHGRLDGVIHAAGLLADGFGREKLPSTFDRVYDTKVKGARNLLAYVPHSVRFFVCFSSVAALYGNRGQTDYAAANDVLDVLARTRPRESALELRSIAWGPWAGTGMVGPELERHYLARGISLIAPELGVAECIDEIMYGDAPHVALLAEPMEAAHARL